MLHKRQVGRFGSTQELQGLRQDTAVDEKRDAQHSPDIPGNLFQLHGRVEQVLETVPQRHPRTQPKCAERRDQGPEVDGLAVAVLMVTIGRRGSSTDANEEKGLVATVDQGMDGLTQHGRRTTVQPREKLGRGDNYIATQGKLHHFLRLLGGSSCGGADSWRRWLRW